MSRCSNYANATGDTKAIRWPKTANKNYDPLLVKAIDESWQYMGLINYFHLKIHVRIFGISTFHL